MEIIGIGTWEEKNSHRDLTASDKMTTVAPATPQLPGEKIGGETGRKRMEDPRRKEGGPASVIG